ncbi:unnamed protein product [Discosporangium mesarthrocarpum]
MRTPYFLCERGKLMMSLLVLSIVLWTPLVSAFQQQRVLQVSQWRGHMRGGGSGRHPVGATMNLRKFEANEIQLQSYIGELGFMEITDWEYYGRKTSPIDPSTPSRTINTSGPTVRLFEGRTYTTDRVLLKEFMPKAAGLAQNEIEIFQRLVGAWEARYALQGRPPVMALLGSLLADENFRSRSFIEKWVSKFPSLELPQAGNTWLVYRWEGLFTFASFPWAKQEGEFFDRFNVNAKEERRVKFVREMMRGAVESLAFMHEAGVAHRSLGSPSLRISTVDERFPQQLEVLLSDIGFSTPVTELDEDTMHRARKFGATSTLEVADFLLREDLYSLGYVFLELVFSSFCTSKARAPDQNSLKRLLEDIFGGDFRDFKDYCLGDDAWERAVAVLDRNSGAGWGLAVALLGSRVVQGNGGDGGGGRGGGGELSMVSTRAILSLPYFKG